MFPEPIQSSCQVTDNLLAATDAPMPLDLLSAARPTGNRMRISADLVLRARAFINPVKDRELDLRALKIPLIENLGVTQDQFDTIDLSDNEVKRLENFPRLRRLRAVLLSNNFLTRIGQGLGDQIGELESLVLTNNKISGLSEIDHLSSLRKLSHLSLVENPVTRQQHYRAYVIHALPNLKSLDFKKVKFEERKAAAKLFRSEAGRRFQEDIEKEGKVMATEHEKTLQERKSLTEDQRRIAAEMIDKATTPDELDRVERQLRAGVFRLPNGSTLPLPEPPAKKRATESTAAPGVPVAAVVNVAPTSDAAASATPSAIASPEETQPDSVSEAAAKQAESPRRAKRQREEETDAALPAGNGLLNGEAETASTEKADGPGQLSEEEIDNMKVAELKEALKERGLPMSGLKADLQARLKENATG